MEMEREESEEIAEDIGTLEKDEEVMNFSQKQDSHPTKEKVTAFKSRVFHLLQLYVEKTKNTTSLLQLLTEESFLKDPNRIGQLIVKVANKNLPFDDLNRFSQFYKKLMLFKHQKDSQKHGEDFINMLKKIKQQNEDAVKEIIQEMLQTVVLKRKCKLNIRFFSFILKRMPWLKQAIVEKGSELSKSQQIRPAQKKILERLLKGLVKSKGVKEENQE